MGNTLVLDQSPINYDEAIGKQLININDSDNNSSSIIGSSTHNHTIVHYIYGDYHPL